MVAMPPAKSTCAPLRRPPPTRQWIGRRPVKLPLRVLISRLADQRHEVCGGDPERTWRQCTRCLQQPDSVEALSKSLGIEGVFNGCSQRSRAFAPSWPRVDGAELPHPAPRSCAESPGIKRVPLVALPCGARKGVCPAMNENPGRNVHICVVDDDAQVTEGLMTFFTSIGHHVKGFGSAMDLLKAVDCGQVFDCIISDVRMPQIDGIELIQELRHREDLTPVLLISGHGDIPMAVSGIKAGAHDFVEKPFDPDTLETKVVDAITAGRQAHCGAQSRLSAKAKVERLSDRQRQIANLVASGLTSKEIGAQLGLSFRTVESHRAWVMERLEARTLADLVRTMWLSESVTVELCHARNGNRRK
jgi:two-component system, LuxR family, response regulator FixJ